MHIDRLISFNRSLSLSRSGFLVSLALLTGCSSEAPGEFNLTHTLIPRADIRSGGPGKDGIPALTEPLFVEPDDADYLGGEDLVIGVARGSEARAYPLRIMVWHEIANDTVGGQPVAVTYCPLCQSALVFDRKVGGEERIFGVSGNLYNSNVLMYDRQLRARDESLWSQGEMRAVTGPAAKDELKLRLLPAELTSWSDWRARHPNTRVLSEETGHRRPYRETAYASYFAGDRLMFPVDLKQKQPEDFARKELLVVVYTEGAARAYAVKDIAAAGGTVEDRIGDRTVRLVHVPDGNSVRVEPADGGPPPPVAHLFWFALSALQPEVEIYGVEP